MSGKYYISLYGGLGSQYIPLWNSRIYCVCVIITRNRRRGDFQGDFADKSHIRRMHSAGNEPEVRCKREKAGNSYEVMNYGADMTYVHKTGGGRERA